MSGSAQTYAGGRPGAPARATRTLRAAWEWALAHQVVSWACIGAVLGAWELAAAAGVYSEFIWEYVPPPSVFLQATFEVVVRPPDARYDAVDQVATTLARTGVALLVGAGVGIPVGILLGWYAGLRRVFTPIVEFIRPTPSLVLLPVFILLLGFGTRSMIATAAVEVFWLMVINSIYGAQSVDRPMINALRVSGLGTLQLFRYAVFPKSLPFIAAGVRSSLGAAFLVVIAVEIIAGSTGLGAMMDVARLQFRTDILYAGMLISLVVGFCLLTGWSKLERYLMPWYFAQAARS